MLRQAQHERSGRSTAAPSSRPATRCRCGHAPVILSEDQSRTPNLAPPRRDPEWQTPARSSELATSHFSFPISFTPPLRVTTIKPMPIDEHFAFDTTSVELDLPWLTLRYAIEVRL